MVCGWTLTLVQTSNLGNHIGLAVMCTEAAGMVGTLESPVGDQMQRTTGAEVWFPEL